MTTTETKKIKLNLGCFDRKIPGYINIDIRPEVNPDIVDDITTLTTIADDSVDVIYACHVLEHLSKMDGLHALANWRRKLKKNGVLRLAVPDIEMGMRHYMLYQDLNYLFSMFWGSQRHPYDFHKMGWDFKTLSETLKTNGFYRIERYDWKETDHFYIDDYSQAYFPHMDKEHGILMSLNVEAIKL